MAHPSTATSRFSKNTAAVSSLVAYSKLTSHENVLEVNHKTHSIKQDTPPQCTADVRTCVQQREAYMDLFTCGASAGCYCFENMSQICRPH